eukprot:285861_1
MEKMRTLREDWRQCESHFKLESGSIKIIDANYYDMVVRNDLDFKYTETNHIPNEFVHKVWYALTASNPCGENKTHEFNSIENDKLLSDLRTLSDPKPDRIIIEENDSNSLDEIGFRLVYNIDDWNSNIDDTVTQMASKYNQGAIYKWYINEDGTLVQEIIPCSEAWGVVACSHPVIIYSKAPPNQKQSKASQCICVIL